MNNEITTYVEGVRRALSGIDAATRDELLEDLPEHLAEVQAEGTGTLVERLGTPEAYARELLTTAGVVGGFPEPPPDRFAELIEARENALRLLRRADVRVGPVIGYPKASDFLVLLRPGWWVLRGYLVAMFLAYLSEGHQAGLLPRLGNNELVALVLLLGCIIVSILLGKRTLSTWPRYAVWSGTALLVLFAWSGFASADDSVRNPGYSQVSTYDNNPFRNVDDVFVYDGQGRLVTGARLFDQDGNPLLPGGDNWCTDPATGESRRSRSLGYPYCPENDPFATPSAGLSTAPTPEPSVAGSAPSPSVSGGPAPSATASTTPRPSVSPSS